ncbi:MAG: hypothetical protein IJR61_04925 [Clostridia bacterium]|nr:hypothetical protein [Clostridia bacterium]
MKTKFAVFMLVLILLCGTCFTGCKNKDNGKDSVPVGTTSENSEAIPATPADEEKPVLLFEIDEGLGGYEFVAGCKKTDGSYDYEKMDVVLSNVYDGIKGLKGKYKPAVHIYPEWYYKAGGWNADYTDGFQKWSPDFIYAMDFFKERGIEVYLEILSSTIYVCQNGEEGALPVVNVNDGISDTERNVWGCSCDFQSLRALKKRYPETFTGLRFHELIGTEALAAGGNKHACRIYEDDVYAIADEAKDLGVDLLWSDQMWGNCFKFSSFAFWLDRVAAVREKLGDKLIIAFANNTADISAVVNFTVYDSLAERFDGIKTGYSNQAWFLDAFIMNDTKCETQAYIPVEIVAGFAQKALLRGAKIVQFEPYFHLFNYTRQNINGGNDYARGGITMTRIKPRYEEIQGDKLDYSPRSELLRLVDYLNADEFAFADLEKFFDESTGKIKTDSALDPPVMYQQTTLALFGNEVAFYDKYNNDSSRWLNQNENRFTARVIDKNAVFTGRLSYTAGGFDDVLTVVKENGNNVGRVYNCISGIVFEDRNTFADNADGEFIGCTAANLIKAKTYRGKDTDEIVTFRKKDGKIKLGLYTANMTGDGYGELTGSSASVLADFFGSNELPAENFLGVYGVRSSKAIGKTSYLRNIDGLVALYAEGNRLTVMGKRKINSADINEVITFGGKVICAAFADADLDINSSDELIAVTDEGGASVYVSAFASDKKFAPAEKVISAGVKGIKHSASFGKFYYQNDTNL